MSIVVLPFYHKVCRWIKDRMNGPDTNVSCYDGWVTDALEGQVGMCLVRLLPGQGSDSATSE